MQLLLILRLLLSLHLQYKGDISDHLISSDRYQRQSAQAAHSFPTYFAAPQLAAYLALHTSLPYLTGRPGHQLYVNQASAAIAASIAALLQLEGLTGLDPRRARLPPPSRTVRLGQGLSALASWTVAGAR